VNQTSDRKIDSRARPEYLRLVCEEPFRVFFPAGVLLGVVGVSLWVLFYLGMRVPSTGSGFS
jgi:uncharacterized protein involved in response to NO